MWRITYKSFTLQQVLMMVWMNVTEAQLSTEVLGAAGGQVSLQRALPPDGWRRALQ
jgi:hypothetical protein